MSMTEHTTQICTLGLNI